MSDSIFSVNRENISTELQVQTTLSWSNIWLLPHEATQRTLSLWPTDISGNWSCAHLMTCFHHRAVIGPPERIPTEPTDQTCSSTYYSYCGLTEKNTDDYRPSNWKKEIQRRQTGDTLWAIGATRGSKTRPRLQSCARENNILLLDRTCVEVSGPLDLFTRPQHYMSDPS